MAVAFAGVFGDFAIFVVSFESLVGGFVIIIMFSFGKGYTV
jgi:hypothetical protein